MPIKRDYETRECAVYNILGILVDGRKEIFPEVVVQCCIVHLIRNSLKYVPTHDYKDFTAHLKKIYGAQRLKACRIEFPSAIRPLTFYLHNLLDTADSEICPSLTST